VCTRTHARIYPYTPTLTPTYTRTHVHTHSHKHALKGFCLGVLNGTVPFVLINIAERRLDSGVVSVLISTIPVCVCVCV